jgi:crotonobetainyl-CoA:carnitine CoA-transferase CaiB-like acyl-CoA transferase
MTTRMSWTECLLDDKPHEVKRAPISIAGMRRGQMMLVPSARLVDAFVRTVKRGRSMDAKQLRDAMARAHGAEVCCPITTGFHLRTVAEAVGEALARGAAIARVTPVWRVLPPGAPTLGKLSYDPAILLRQRRLEGLDGETAK